MSVTLVHFLMIHKAFFLLRVFVSLKFNFGSCLTFRFLCVRYTLLFIWISWNIDYYSKYNSSISQCLYSFLVELLYGVRKYCLEFEFLKGLRSINRKIIDRFNETNVYIRLHCMLHTVNSLKIPPPQCVFKTMQFLILFLPPK